MLYIETITTPGLAQNSYIIVSQDEAFIIDPRRDIEIYVDRLHKKGWTLKGVAETHSHADFVAGSIALAEATGAPFYSGAYTGDFPHEHLEDGQIIVLGDAEIVALHTPGHTPDHFAYYVTDRHDARQAPALFSGDVMFVGDLGRPELLGEATAQELAPALYDTVWNKLRPLPGHTVLYPGHGAGSLCGKNLSDKPTSTLDTEFATSPVLQLEREAFIHEMLTDQPRVPEHFSTMVGINKGGAPAPRKFEEIPAISATEVRQAIDDPDTLVLDARSAEDYSAGHLPGTTYLGVNPGMPTWMGWLVDPEDSIVALVKTKEQAEDLQRWMVRVGFDKLDGYHVLDTTEWATPLEKAITIDGTEFNPANAPAQFIDVRTPAEFALGTLAGARSIPLCELPDRLNELDKEKPLVLFCQGGYRGTIAASLLEQAGFTNVMNVMGGYGAVSKATTSCSIAGPR